MRTKRGAFLIFLLALTAAAVLAADVSGKWVAQMQGRNGQTQEVTFNFKADGNQLTGTVTTRRGESQISDGKINGDEISFTQELEFNGNRMKFLYKGKVAGDEIKFTREREGGQRTQEFTAKRAS
jgi:hypothetical protein